MELEQFGIPPDKAWKYAKIEWERRFLLEGPPSGIAELPHKQLKDWYLTDTRLRLRCVIEQQRVYKLGKKVPLSGKRKGGIRVSNLYLSAEEYTLFAQLPGVYLEKMRYIRSAVGEPDLAIDCIDLGTRQLWLAEVECETQTEMNAYVMSIPYLREVSDDPFFQGFHIADLYQKVFPDQTPLP